MLSLLVWESVSLWPLAAALAGALTFAVLWFYPAQVRGVGVAGLLPPVLRWAGVAVLAVSLLKPVLLQPKTADQWGDVAILVDCSRSMGVTDLGRKAAERVALAAALGRVPQGARSDAGSDIADELDRLATLARQVLGAQADLDYARVSGRGIAEKEARLHEAAEAYAAAAHSLVSRSALAGNGELRQHLKELDAIPPAESRDAWAGRVTDRINKAREAARNVRASADEKLYKSDPHIRAICDEVAKLPRLALAEEALLRPDAGLLARLGPDVPVIGLALENGLRTVALTSKGRPIGKLPLSADGHDSDLAGAVTAAPSVTRRPLRAIVLLSDGRQVGGRGDIISAIRPGGVPVFTIGMAPEQTPDVSITGVSLAATSAFAGETIDGDAHVRYEGAVNPPSELHVSSSGGEQTERLAPDSGRQKRGRGEELSAHFSFPVQPRDGRPVERIVLSVPVSPGEATTENNRVERWIKVSDQKLKVAACTAAPNWDFQYLRAALSRRPWVQLESRVLDPEHPRLTLTPREILEQDVLIIDDVPVDALNAAQWGAVHDLLSQRGASVILIAGTSYQVSDYVRQSFASQLLPFGEGRATWKEWPGELAAFHFVPTPLGDQEALRVGEDAEGSMRRWQDLPALYRYLQIPEKTLHPGVRKLLLESSTGAAVLTEHRLGAGRVLFLGLNETWRWRLKSGERDADRFWRQLVRYAAGEPYAAVSGPLALDVDKVAIEPGAPLHVRARVRAGRLRTTKTGSCPVEIVRDGKVVLTRQLRSAGGGHFVGDILDLPEGDCRIRLSGASDDGANVSLEVPVHVGASSEAEMRDVSGDPAMLARIARVSGGQYLPIEQIDRLPEQLGALRGADSQFIRRPLWNSPFLFAFVLACFGGEWALRKRLGLA